jgi:hypothetical protein
LAKSGFQLFDALFQFLVLDRLLGKLDDVLGRVRLTVLDGDLTEGEAGVRTIDRVFSLPACR